MLAQTNFLFLRLQVKKKKKVRKQGGIALWQNNLRKDQRGNDEMGLAIPFQFLEEEPKGKKEVRRKKPYNY